MTLKRLLGLDTRADRYSYATDQVAGYVSAQKVPDKWVATTCGYCSVGCGMFIGVKGNRAVSVRGNPDHPVNRGMLCPKGLSEHHTIAADNRARYPLLRRNGEFGRVSWDEAFTTMATKFRETQARYGPDSVGVISTGQLVTEEFYALGKLVQLGIGTTKHRRQHHALHVHRRLGLQAVVRQRRSSRRVRGSGTRRRHHPHRRQRRGEPSDSVLASALESEQHADRRRSARHQDGDAGRSPSAAEAAVGPRADQRVHPLRDRERSRRSRVRRPSHQRLRRVAGVSSLLYARAGGGDHGTLVRVDLPDGMDLRACPRRVHRLDDGRQPQHEGHRDRQRDQQPRADHRQHRARRCGAVLDHRPVQCHGDARGRVCVEPAGLSQVRERRRSARAGTALGRVRGAHSERARPGVSRHHRGGARSTHPGVVDHRHQPGRLVSQLRLAPPGARVARFPGRAGRVSPDSDIRIRALDAAGGDVGREGRDLHQLRAAGEQGQSRSAAARGGARGLRHLPGSRRCARRPRRDLSWLDEAGRRVRGMETDLRRASLRLLRHDLQGHRAARWHPVATSGRHGA